MLLAERWILARLRNRRFFSLAELNAAIAELVAELNARLMRGFGSSRAELFAEIDRLKLGELPDQPYALRAGSAAASRQTTMSRSTATGIPPLTA